MKLPPIKKPQLLLISGVILILFALFALKIYVDQVRVEADKKAKEKLKKSQANQSAVLVAKKDIDRGVVIEPDSLDVQVFPNQFVQPGAVTSLDRISGMTTIASISKGEQITLSKLTYQRTGGLASITPVGKRAVTIPADNISSLSGMIKGGDYIDVIALIPIPMQTPDGKTMTQIRVMPLFQNVLVLAVGQNLGSASQEEGRYRKEENQQPATTLITLALSPQEASLITFVQEQGKIRLILRSPTDAKIEPIQSASWDTLFQYLMPPQIVAPGGATQEPREEGPSVEIYRGLNKEKIPLAK